MLFVSKLIPITAESLKLGIFKNVAVREEEGYSEVSYADNSRNEINPVEVITFYNRIRSKDYKFKVQALHIFFKGTPDELTVIGYTTSEKPSIKHGTWYKDLINMEGSTKIGEVKTCYENLAPLLNEWIFKAQKIFNVEKASSKRNPFYDETVGLLTKSYGENFSDLERMSVHFSIHNPTVQIICETGWGSDFRFNLTKDKKHISMTVDIDPREVSEDTGSTYKEVREIYNGNFAETLEGFFLNCNFITKKVLEL